MFRKFSNTFSLIIAGGTFLLAFIFYLFNTNTTSEICAKAEKALFLKEKQTQEAIKWFNSNVDFNTIGFTDGLLSNKAYFDKEGIIVLAYRNDSLKVWTSNEAPMDMPASSLTQNNGIVHLRNGWYEYFCSTNKSIKTVALLLLKPEYDVQNSYFNNSFAGWLNLPPQSELKYPAAYLPHTIKSSLGTNLFEVTTKNDDTVSTELTANWPLLLFFLALSVFLYSLIKYFFTKTISPKQFFVFSISLLIVRSLMIYFKLPALLYDSGLYNIYTYGITDSFYNKYLGDVLINVIVFFVWSIIFYKKLDFRIFGTGYKFPITFIYLAILIALSLQLNATVKNLVINSTISLDFSNFFNLSHLSFLCLGIVFINGFSISMHIEKLIFYLCETNIKQAVLFLLSSFAAYTALYLLGLNQFFSVIEWFWLPLLISISFIFRKYDFTQSILSAGFRVLVFAIITSWIFSEYNSIREAQNLKHLSEQLSDRQDAFLESEFLKVSKKIKKDAQLAKAINRLPLQSTETEQQLRQIYFTKYFEKYNINLAIFDSLCMPYLKNSNYLLNNHEYFDDQIKDGFFTISDELFFIDTYKPNSRYVGKIELNKPANGKSAYSLYIQLEPKQFTEAGSFSELLLDAPQQKQNRYKEFSYALYKNGNLNSAFGKYIYPKFFSASVISQNTDVYQHKLILPDPETQIVLSSKIKDFNYYFTANSYYFLFYSLLSVLFFVFAHRLNSNGNSFFTLNRRIQFFIISVLFLAILAVGVFTINLVIKKSEDDQSKLLTEKARQIQKELNHQLLYNQRIDINSKSFTESVLLKYSELINSDISLYNEKGMLFASSRPQLFTSGLISKFINPLAVLHFDKNKSLYFITHDKIGSLNYLSLYTPIYTSAKKISGYINLPYFARQNDLEDGVSDYITTLINIYVVLFLISLFTGLIVSIYITKPLRILQEQLAKITLGKKNESISWQSNDEIGQLVNEYNQMLLKLEESALLLAKSEREGAWQEMAKQVAHEIKNPLTPMKLNLQYLQKIVNDDGIDFAERFKKASDSLIEQIDTLAHIANEFSNFAKMPKVNLEVINLNEIINSTIELFKNNEKSEITLHSETDSVLVLADKNQCLRIFNNLIKNATQAIPDDKKGKIEIAIKQEGAHVLVSLRDNGSGIPNQMKDKIFVPNFTTKTTGTGLGLAMVKNIMTSFNGEIWFESEENEGTTFYLKFQKKH